MTQQQQHEDHDNPSDVESESTDIRTSKTIGRIALALAKAQAEFGAIKKSGEATIKPKDKQEYSYKYADLASAIAATRPALNSHGIAVLATAVTVSGGVEVSTRLVHESGEWIESARLFMACDAKPQNVGSAITYARRYQYLALLGLALLGLWGLRMAIAAPPKGPPPSGG